MKKRLHFQHESFHELDLAFDIQYNNHCPPFLFTYRMEFFITPPPPPPPTQYIQHVLSNGATYTERNGEIIFPALSFSYSLRMYKVLRFSSNVFTCVRTRKLCTKPKKRKGLALFSPSVSRRSDQKAREEIKFLSPPSIPFQTGPQKTRAFQIQNPDKCTVCSFSDLGEAKLFSTYCILLSRTTISSEAP